MAPQKKQRRGGLSPAEEKRIARALADTEAATGLACVLHLEDRVDGDAAGRAKMLWAFHGLHETDGVLIFVALQSGAGALFAGPSVVARYPRWDAIRARFEDRLSDPANAITQLLTELRDAA